MNEILKKWLCLLLCFFMLPGVLPEMSREEHIHFESEHAHEEAAHDESDEHINALAVCEDALGFMLSLFAVPVHAAYEDGVECDYCGGWRYDDWKCDNGDHCGEGSGTSCYEEHHCGYCGACDDDHEMCDDCGNCLEDHCECDEKCRGCYETSGDVCDVCGEKCTECVDFICDDCGICAECAGNELYCSYCNLCIGCADWICYCGDACSQCAVSCPGCREKCTACAEDELCQECWYCWDCMGGEGNYCRDCKKCKDCVDAVCYNGDGCSECVLVCEECGEKCENCADGGVCGKCGVCADCAGDYCAYCDLCERCVDWICYCGEGCSNCAVVCADCGEVCSGCSDEICQECGKCADCAGSDSFCLNCGLCSDCGIVCPCGEGCENCADLCPDCGEVCSSCSDEFCASCDLCRTCAGDLFCEDCSQCGGCTEVCEDCGIVCTDCAESVCDNCGKCSGCIDAFCPDCGICMDCADAMCQDCFFCGDCADNICSDCGEYCSDCAGFCTECGKCENCVEICPDCELCGDCCAERAEDFGCRHGICPESDEWKKHYCPSGNHCAGNSAKTEYDENEHWQECTFCHETTEKAAHRPGGWETTVKPGYTFAGEKQRACKICGYTDRESIPMLTVPDHKLVITIPDVPVRDPDQTTDAAGDSGTDGKNTETVPPVTELLTKGSDNTVPALPVLMPKEEGNLFEGWVNAATGEPVKKGDKITGSVELSPVWKDCGDGKHRDSSGSNRCDECGYLLVQPQPESPELPKIPETTGSDDEEPADGTAPETPPFWFLWVIAGGAGIFILCGIVVIPVLKRKKEK